MELLMPHTGTVIWMLISFIIVLTILKKFAWKPILGALKAREDSIDQALRSAELARDEMQSLQAKNEKIIAEAKVDRDKIIKEARELKDEIVNEAKQKALSEAEKLIESARESIKNEKLAAIKEIKEQVASLSINIAEKIMQEKLEDDEKQKEIIDRFLRDVKMN
jgi:F-type H+-transporting ATPase subunit b